MQKDHIYFGSHLHQIKNKQVCLRKLCALFFRLNWLFSALFFKHFLRFYWLAHLIFKFSEKKKKKENSPTKWLRKRKIKKWAKNAIKKKKKKKKKKKICMLHKHFSKLKKKKKCIFCIVFFHISSETHFFFCLFSLINLVCIGIKYTIQRWCILFNCTQMGLKVYLFHAKITHFFL